MIIKKIQQENLPNSVISEAKMNGCCLYMAMMNFLSSTANLPIVTGVVEH